MITNHRSAFSLVETALALGLVAFCVVALIGLMPASLDAIGNADREAEAARWVRQMATGIRIAAPDEDGNYRLTGFKPFSEITWTSDGRPLPVEEGFLNTAGTSARESDAAFAWRVEITPPDADDPSSLGRAMLRIAWPAASRWSGKEWKQAQGSEEALVLFRAK